MSKTTVKPSKTVVNELFEGLALPVKISLIRQWERRLWPDRFRNLLGRTRSSAGQNPRLAKKALDSVAAARRAFHAGRR